MFKPETSEAQGGKGVVCVCVGGGMCAHILCFYLTHQAGFLQSFYVGVCGYSSVGFCFD